MKKEIFDDNEGKKIIEQAIERYCKGKESPPIENKIITINSDENTYKFIRLNDEQYYLLQQNSLAIFEDYSHLIALCYDNNLIYSSQSRMYVALKLLFGNSGSYYDDWKGSFSFPFLIDFQKNNAEFKYLMNLHNVKSSIEFSIRKLIRKDDDSFNRDILHKPFDEFPREEIKYFINFFMSYLSGYFDVTHKHYNEFFYQTVRSNLILFGYKNGHFFDWKYESEEELDEEILKLDASGYSA